MCFLFSCCSWHGYTPAGSFPYSYYELLSTDSNFCGQKLPPLDVVCSFIFIGKFLGTYSFSRPSHAIHILLIKNLKVTRRERHIGRKYLSSSAKDEHLKMDPKTVSKIPKLDILFRSKRRSS